MNLLGGHLYWKETEYLEPKSYTCGYCGNKVASERGYEVGEENRTVDGIAIYICHFCDGPTFFDKNGVQRPGVLIGEPVKNIPSDIEALYEEARQSFSAGAYTGVVMLSRKMLMNLAVSFGAEEGKSFVTYVDYLVNEGYVSRAGRAWVDHIRLQGNGATHKIELKTAEEAENLLKFVEMLLKINYEYPSIATPAAPPSE